MVDFLRQIFGPADFMLCGYCYWNPALMWLKLLSDSVITVSYLIFRSFSRGVTARTSNCCPEAPQ